MATPLTIIFFTLCSKFSSDSARISFLLTMMKFQLLISVLNCKSELFLKQSFERFDTR